MKTHKIDPNKLSDKPIATFTIEFRCQPIPPLDGGPGVQRFMRLTEVADLTGSDAKPRQTVWHELYAHEFSTPQRFAKWCLHKGTMFKWTGTRKSFFDLLYLMSELASKEQVSKPV